MHGRAAATRGRLLGRAAIGLLVLAFVGCQTAPPRTAEAPSDEPSLPIVATDAGHEAPDSVAAGWRHVRFENRGTMIHEALLVRLPDGMTAAGYAEAVAAGHLFPDKAIDCSGPGLTSPGETLDLWVRLDPGRYVTTCWFRHPDTDTAATLHVVQAPPRGFVVGAAVQNDSTPAADATLRLVDYRFELEGEIKPGMRTVRVEMPSSTMHEMDVYRLHDGRTLDDLKAWYKARRRTPPPATSVGGVLDSHEAGRTVWIRREFTPGRYVAWCGMDMPVANGVKPTTHADHGMVLEFSVAD